MFKYGISIDVTNEKTLQVQISNTSEYLGRLCIDESMLYTLNQQSAGDWSFYYTDERTANKPLIKDLFNLLLKTFSLILKYNGNKSYSLISELNYPTNVTDLYNINDNDKYSYFKSNVIKSERAKSYFNADSKRATNRESYYQSQVQTLSITVFNKDNVYSLNSNNEIIQLSNVSTLENIESFVWYNNLVFMLREDLDYGDVETGFLSVYFEFFTNELFDRVGIYDEELITTNLINTIYTVRELNLDLDSQTVTIKQEKAI
jgi:membrane-bound inhibitor of C-type lysozyme